MLLTITDLDKLFGIVVIFMIIEIGSALLLLVLPLKREVL